MPLHFIGCAIWAKTATWAKNLNSGKKVTTSEVWTSLNAVVLPDAVYNWLWLQASEVETWKLNIQYHAGPTGQPGKTWILTWCWWDKPQANQHLYIWAKKANCAEETMWEVVHMRMMTGFKWTGNILGEMLHASQCKFLHLHCSTMQSQVWITCKFQQAHNVRRGKLCCSLHCFLSSNTEGLQKTKGFKDQKCPDFLWCRNWTSK